MVTCITICLAFEWEAITYSELIHPKVEPEIAFLLAEDLQGENVTAEDVIEGYEVCGTCARNYR